MNRIHLKPETASTGFFYLDHLPTGKVYTGVSKNMQQSIQELSELLDRQQCKDRTLSKLYQTEPNFKAYCTGTRTLRDAKSAEREFRSGKPDHLLIN